MEVYPYSDVRTTYIRKTERLKAIRANIESVSQDQEENSRALSWSQLR